MDDVVLIRKLGVMLSRAKFVFMPNSVFNLGDKIDDVRIHHTADEVRVVVEAPETRYSAAWKWRGGGRGEGEINKKKYVKATLGFSSFLPFTRIDCSL